MKKILLVLIFISTYLSAAMNLQTASKEELMSIAGIGAKKAQAIMDYRKKHTIKSAADLQNVKGIGQNIIKNVKGNVTNKASSALSTSKNMFQGSKSKASNLKDTASNKFSDSKKKSKKELKRAAKKAKAAKKHAAKQAKHAAKQAKHAKNNATNKAKDMKSKVQNKKNNFTKNLTSKF
jgi:competence protein ComEA